MTYGFSIDRAGTVWANLRRTVHGRCPREAQTPIGAVWRDGRRWRHDRTDESFATQEAAAKHLYAAWQVTA